MSEMLNTVAPPQEGNPPSPTFDRAALRAQMYAQFAPGSDPEAADILVNNTLNALEATHRQASMAEPTAAYDPARHWAGQATRTAERAQRLDPLAPETMRDDEALSGIYLLGHLALRGMTSGDLRLWAKGRMHDTDSPLAASGERKGDGSLYWDRIDALLARWQRLSYATQEKATPYNFSVPFSSPETTHSAKQGRTNRKSPTNPFASAYAYAGPDVGTPVLPEAAFSSAEEPQRPPQPRPYTPTFNTKFEDASYSPSATAEVQRILSEVASERNIKPGDVLGRVGIVKEALKRSHPDVGGDHEAAQLLNAMYRAESNTPAAQAAKAARREAAKAAPVTSTPASSDSAPAAPTPAPEATAPVQPAASEAPAQTIAPEAPAATQPAATPGGTTNEAASPTSTPTSAANTSPPVAA